MCLLWLNYIINNFNMKKLLLLSVLFLWCCEKTDKTNSVAQNSTVEKVSKPKSEDHSQIIYNFYKEYFANGKNSEQILEKYTTKQLRQILNAYTSDGENLVLDYDPFIDGQDYDEETLIKTLKVKPLVGNLYQADFCLFPDKNSHDNHRTVTYKLVPEDGKMKIAEIPSDAVLKDLKYIDNNPQNNRAAIDAAIRFGKWYLHNRSNFFDTVRGGMSEPSENPANYYVDFVKVDKEIAFIRRINLFTENFLKNYYENYKIGEENFRKHPANDGTPEGFDADYFFRTQEDFEPDLKKIDKIQYQAIPFNNNQIFLKFRLLTTGIDYLWTMKNENGWKIDQVNREDN